MAYGTERNTVIGSKITRHPIPGRLTTTNKNKSTGFQCDGQDVDLNVLRPLCNGTEFKSKFGCTSLPKSAAGAMSTTPDGSP